MTEKYKRLVHEQRMFDYEQCFSKAPGASELEPFKSLLLQDEEYTKEDEELDELEEIFSNLFN